VAKFGSIEEFRAALNNLVANTGRSNPRRRRNPGQMFEALSAAGFETEEEVPEIGPRVAYTTRVQQLRAAAAAGDIDAAYELRDLEMRGERQRQKRKGKKKRGRKAAANPKRTKLLRRKQVRSSLWPEDSAQARMRTNMAFPKTIAEGSACQCSGCSPCGAACCPAGSPGCDGWSPCDGRCCSRRPPGQEVPFR
jgi:hypothetical protein